MTTNIKGLPEGNHYWTEYGWSQSYPWVETGRTKSGRTVKLAKVYVKPDPEWKEKMKMHPGGFAAHCSNQSQQTWLFDRIDRNHVKTIRLCKRGWKAPRSSSQFKEGRAIEYYDYNF